MQLTVHVGLSSRCALLRLYLPQTFERQPLCFAVPQPVPTAQPAQQRGAPVGHAAGHGQHGVQAREQDAVQQHLACAGQQCINVGC